MLSLYIYITVSREINKIKTNECKLINESGFDLLMDFIIL